MARNHMTKDQFTDEFCKALHLKGYTLLGTEDTKNILEALRETLEASLLEYPNVHVGEMGFFSLSRLDSRKRVLRGVTYQVPATYRVRYYAPEEFTKSLKESYDIFDLEDDQV